MRKTLILILLGFVLIFSCKIGNSQNNFQPGYIITLNNDTLKGYIDYYKWHKNPDKISFRLSTTSESIIYTPLDIKSFYVKDELSYYIKDEMFVSAIVEVDKSPHKTGELSQDNTSKLDTDTIFLSLYFQGKYNLYQYRDENEKVHFLIDDPNGVIRELLFRRYLKPKPNGTSSITGYTYYRNMLKYYLSDEPSLNILIENASYSSDNLINILKKYSVLKGVDNKKFFEPAAKHFVLNFSILGGLYYNRFFSEIDIPSNLGYTFGVGLNVASARRKQRLSWQPELLFYNEKISYYYTAKDPISIATYEYSCDLDSYYGKLNILGKYQLDYGSFKPYLNAGFSIGILMAYSGERTFTKHFGFSTTITNENIDRTSIGVVAGIGTYYKRFNFELRYETAGTAIPDYSENIYVLLGVNLFQASTVQSK